MSITNPNMKANPATDADIAEYFIVLSLLPAFAAAIMESAQQVITARFNSTRDMTDPITNISVKSFFLLHLPKSLIFC
jgi:hypothetical protein